MAGSPKTFTKEEVAKHASEESCWIIIENKVYDVTNWLNTHPGGKEILLENGGGDATEAFSNVGHTQSAKEMMPNYYIGEIQNPAQCQECGDNRWLILGGVVVVGIVVGVGLYFWYRK